MKKIINKIVHQILRVTSLLILPIIIYSSCSKFIQVDDPIGQIVTSTAFQDEQTATSAIMGIYSNLLVRSASIGSGGVTLYTGLTADELYYTGTDQGYIGFYNNTIHPNSGIISNDIWRFAYQYIYQTNACIAGLESSLLDLSVKNQLLGEVYTIRAFCYWYLVNLFGDVPLILDIEYQANSKAGRISSDVIYQQIVLDLETAYDLLDKEYHGYDRDRVNKWTAAAFLARVHLYLGNWQVAREYATEVIMQPQYRLEEDLNSVFRIESQEVIWRLVERTPNLRFTVESGKFIPSTLPNARPVLAIDHDLLDDFDPTDERLTNWTTSRTIFGVNYTYPFKFKYRTSALGQTEALTPFRLAELYLIRAEAQTNLGEYPEALEYLNMVRVRAGLNKLFSDDKPEILDFIIRERRIEFFAEWGHRWFDLKRTGKINEVLSKSKSNWTHTAALWPIPVSEIQRNPNLTQNPGYE